MGVFGRQVARVSMAVAGSLLLAMTAVSTADAATPRNGKCEVGEFCLYYGSMESSSVSDFNGSVADYGSTQPSCYEFKGEGTGRYQCVKNNASQAWNRTTGHTVILYFSGGSITLAVDAVRSLNERNTSHKFIKN